jgi:hypothetical protein
MSATHPTPDQIDRYRTRSAAPDELLAVDSHLAECDRCYSWIRGTSADQRITLSPVPSGESDHLTYEELERWVDGKSGPVERELIDAHTQVCDGCRGELADLIRVRDVQASAASTPQTGRRFLVPIAAAIAAAFVGAFFVMRREPGPPPQPPPRMPQTSVPQPLPPSPVPTLAKPAVVRTLAGDSSPLLGSADGKTFALIEPIGTRVIDPALEFRWRALPGAQSYSITIADAKSGAIAAHSSTSGTSWRPPHPLTRGRIYSWQVKAHRARDEVTAPRPPAPEALFEVASGELITEIGSWPGDHLTRGIRFAERGFLGEAERELTLARDAGDSSASGLLAQVRSWRNR